MHTASNFQLVSEPREGKWRNIIPTETAATKTCICTVCSTSDHFTCKYFLVIPQPQKSAQLAAVNWHISLPRYTHQSSQRSLLRVDFISDSFSCACVQVECVWALCRCVKLTLHQSPALGAMPHFTIPLVPPAPK